MKIESVELKIGIVLLKVSGDVVGDDALRLREELEKLLEKDKPKIIIDLEGVPGMDCTGLGVLVSLQVSVSQKEGRFVLLNPSKGMMNLFAITKLYELADIYESLEEAQSSFET